jgi:hypothetical protein
MVSEALDLSSWTPIELENRRRAICELAVARFGAMTEESRRDYKGSYDTLSTTELHELCAITQRLRQKTAGPPKAGKARGTAKSPKLTPEDLLSQL